MHQHPMTVKLNAGRAKLCFITVVTANQNIPPHNNNHCIFATFGINLKLLLCKGVKILESFNVSCILSHIFTDLLATLGCLELVG